ncbi:hypothetical protein Q9R28_00405 [Curtobacterium sp. BRD11]|nr:hypothetical protein [Curtobacterium sp. BRD11]MDT0209038.1 hypothetical protein [Curtobacterium sp. BRD11]
MQHYALGCVLWSYDVETADAVLNLLLQVIVPGRHERDIADLQAGTLNNTDAGDPHDANDPRFAGVNFSLKARNSAPVGTRLACSAFRTAGSFSPLSGSCV